MIIVPSLLSNCDVREELTAPAKLRGPAQVEGVFDFNARRVSGMEG